MFFNDLTPKKQAKRPRQAGELYVMPVAQDDPIDFFTDAELIAEAGGEIVFDGEMYPNYTLFAFKSLASGKVIFFELSPDSPTCDVHKLYWLLNNFTLIGFNSEAFDIPLVWLMAAGAPAHVIFRAVQMLIHEGARGRDLEKQFGYTILNSDHIDVMPVAPLQGSLKLYAGRLHARKMQDLPYSPERYLSASEAAEVARYCVNDLDNTALIYRELAGQFKLRRELSQQYNIDLRSKSDAQIAEAVICSELKKVTGRYPKRPTVEEDERFQYIAPEFIQFQTPMMQEVLHTLTSVWYEIDGAGRMKVPEVISSLNVKINNTAYAIGNGGLHSKEKKAAHFSTDDMQLIDRDVASYYPAIVLNCGLSPAHLGKPFLDVYRTIVERRLQAKKAKDSVTADSLKITINGTFGKLGSKYSALYSPDLLIQVTLTGQLSLLMLIERLELEGVPVVSANTDGIVMACPHSKANICNHIVGEWERETGFVTEDTEYKALLSRDVNNYVAVKSSGAKGKGAYTNPWLDPKTAIFRFHKNPEAFICVNAVHDFLSVGKPIADTINECEDIRQFVCVRNVKGGAVKDGVYLGKVIRWYYKTAEIGDIRYKDSGNLVPKSEGAWPLMVLPKKMPLDIDKGHYIRVANEMLTDLGY